MRFELTDEQRAFGEAIDALLGGSDTPAIARAWAEGDHSPGLALWKRLADQGLTMLATEATAVEVCVAFEALGRHAVPGPWVESAAYLPVALGREVEGVGTVAVPPHVPYALDADVADEAYVVEDGVASLVPREGYSTTEVLRSVDPTRRLVQVPSGGRGGRASARHETGDIADAAFDLAALATAAQLLGAGERVLADSVAYVQQRKQFGRPVGSYQAVKHRLADVRIALDFARPLVYGAALVSTGSTTERARAVSAGKVASGDAAYLATRTGLQGHGAIGYTLEFDLSLWLTKIRALVSAWGTPAFHRARILDSLLEARA